MFFIHPLGERDQSNMAELLKSTFLDGGCGYLALALHTGLGWPLIEARVDGKFIHYAVRTPKDKFWDARGEVDDKHQLVETFGVRGQITVIDTTEEKLRAFAEFEYDDDHQVQSALGYAQVVWPELPWKSETPRCRVQAFAHQLEKLSREHGIWIREGMVYIGDESENGYSLQTTISGFTFGLSRILK